MGVLSSESHDLTAFYEMLMASFGVLSQNTGFYPSLDRIVATMLRPLNLGPGGGPYNEPISCLHNSLKPSFHGLDMRVRQFEAFIPWVGSGSRMVWGLHSMGWTWELDGLKLKFHGLYVGVRCFEVWEFEVFIPWVEHSSLTFTFESSILKFKH